VNVPIRRIIVVFGLLFLALLWNVEYVQVIQAGSLSKRPDNRRVLLDEYSRERGPILVGGDPIAQSVETKDALVYQREYVDGPLYGHITGFYSSIYGRTYLEESENPILAGTDNRLFVRRVIDLATGHNPQGGSVLLTIDARAQKAADDELGDKVGAVVGDRTEDRPHPRDGVAPDLRPEQAREPQRVDAAEGATRPTSPTRRTRCSTGPPVSATPRVRRSS